MVICCKVPTKEGERIRRFLLDNNLLNKDYKLKKENDFLYIPLTSLDETTKSNLKKMGIDEFVELEVNNILKKSTKKQMSFREYLLKNL